MSQHKCSSDSTSVYDLQLTTDSIYLSLHSQSSSAIIVFNVTQTSSLVRTIETLLMLSISKPRDKRLSFPLSLICDFCVNTTVTLYLFSGGWTRTDWVSVGTLSCTYRLSHHLDPVYKVERLQLGRANCVDFRNKSRATPRIKFS